MSVEKVGVGGVLRIEKVSVECCWMFFYQSER